MGIDIERRGFFGGIAAMLGLGTVQAIEPRCEGPSCYYQWNGGGFSSDPKYPDGVPFDASVRVMVDGREVTHVTRCMTGRRGFVEVIIRHKGQLVMQGRYSVAKRLYYGNVSIHIKEAV